MFEPRREHIARWIIAVQCYHAMRNQCSDLIEDAVSVDGLGGVLLSVIEKLIHVRANERGHCQVGNCFPAHGSVWFRLGTFCKSCLRCGQ